MATDRGSLQKEMTLPGTSPQVPCWLEEGYRVLITTHLAGLTDLPIMQDEDEESAEVSVIPRLFRRRATERLGESEKHMTSIKVNMVIHYEVSK